MTWFEGRFYHRISLLKTPLKMFMALDGSRINKLILINPRSRKCSTTAPRCFFFRGWTSPRPCRRPPRCWPARGAMDGNHGVGHGNGSGNWKRALWYFQEETVVGILSNFSSESDEEKPSHSFWQPICCFTPFGMGQYQITSKLGIVSGLHIPASSRPSLHILVK